MIIVTGTLAWDHIMEFPGKFGDHILPDQTQNINLSFIVKTFAKRRGGTAGNVSYAMGLLKTPHILFTPAGNDFAEYKKTFDTLGINTQHIFIDKKDHTATGFAMTDKSGNQIWGYYYGAASKFTSLHLKKIATKNDLVLIGPQGAKGSMWFIKQCIEQEIPYIFDPGFILTEVTDEDLEKGLRHALYIIGNEYEIEIMQRRVTSWKDLITSKTLITTKGEKGAEIYNDGKKIFIQPVVVKTVETTGAGDAWRGGFLAGLDRGFSLKTCGQMGALAASFAVGNYGTQEYTYTKQSFQKAYRQAFGTLLKL